MQLSVKTGLFLALLVICAHLASGLKCYECQGKEDCKKANEKSCKKAVTCKKITSTNDPFIVKDCGEDENGDSVTHFTGCTDTNRVPVLGEVTTCGCSSNLCNSSTQLAASIASILGVFGILCIKFIH